MKTTIQQSGFSAVELLITLFIAAAFIASGYQLYISAIKDGGEARMRAIAANTANDYLQRYKTSAVQHCNGTVVAYDANIIVTGLANVHANVTITCPYPSMDTISKVTSTITYDPSKTTSIATYVKP